MARGTLRIYLGAAPGVGKSYAMLEQAHEWAQQGRDVVVGLVETHGRAATAALVEGLEVLPRRAVQHQGVALEEMDLDAILERAPEVVLAMAGPPDAAAGATSAQRVADLAAEGERVLGFGAKRLPASVEHLKTVDLAGGVDFLGLMGFLDPPRPEAVAAIAECRSAGVAVKMITGDHVATAVAIGRQLALDERIEAMTGAEVDALTDAALAEAVSFLTRR